MMGWGGWGQSFPPGQERVNLDIHIIGDDASQTIHMKVLTTDYNHFAMVSYSTFIYDIEYVTLFLYGESLLHPLRDQAHRNCRMCPQTSKT